MSNQQPELFRRHEYNPILSFTDWPYPINKVFNPGATLLRDGTTLLLCRVEDRCGHSHFGVARSANGINNWHIDSKPTLMSDPDKFPEELWGIEDPRITWAPELSKYVVVYTAFTCYGPGVALPLTEDFQHFERYGVIMSPEDKDAALLPHRIDGHWALIHRPVSGPRAHIWISYSPDLRHWGNHRLILEARRGAWWDANKIGLSPPPIETAEGWLPREAALQLECADPREPDAEGHDLPRVSVPVPVARSRRERVAAMESRAAAQRPRGPRWRRRRVRRPARRAA